MPNFEVDYMYALPVFESTVIEADDKEHADFRTQEMLKETYPDAVAISVEGIMEIVNNGA